MAYVPEQLAIVCPFCHAAVGSKCLERKRDGMEWIEEPHPERVRSAAQEKQCGGDGWS
jgi:hypothetical protein